MWSEQQVDVPARISGTILVDAATLTAINPDLMQGQIVLGDTLAALHRDHESAAAYNKALSIALRMEPSAKADWIAMLHTKLAALHP